jgi:hypothetical protein
MPRATMTTTTAVNPGIRRNERTICRVAANIVAG